MNIPTDASHGDGVVQELQEAVDRILRSQSQRKLVVAGPGTGKTYLFRRLLETGRGDKDSRIVLTFINNLKKDLEHILSDLARVNTLHGYCHSLLHRHTQIRGELTSDFECLPELASLIESDWGYLQDGPNPQFEKQMRNLTIGVEAASFYMRRANYYDAVAFDDSVYRTYDVLTRHPQFVQGIDLVLIDEYQDFNGLEAAFIEILAEHNPIVIAGDDDQALYGQRRDANWDHIRALYHSERYEKFPLPFCMRCPEVVVSAVNDILIRARRDGLLGGRIDKAYRYFEPKKGADSRMYPRIAQVMTTVQRDTANYFGRYIGYAVSQIRNEEIKEAQQNGDPVALVIGGSHYRNIIDNHLKALGYQVDSGTTAPHDLVREDGFRFLRRDPESNLGWRVVIEFEGIRQARGWIRTSVERGCKLCEVISPELRVSVLNEVAQWNPDGEEAPAAIRDDDAITIKSSTFEGAKGLAAQHVFIVGMQDGELPRDSAHVEDIEVCKFVVGLTRTRKKCTLMHTRNFAGQWKRPSSFLSWIDADRCEFIRIDKAFLNALER